MTSELSDNAKAFSIARLMQKSDPPSADLYSKSDRHSGRSSSSSASLSYTQVTRTSKHSRKTSSTSVPSDRPVTPVNAQFDNFSSPLAKRQKTDEDHPVPFFISCCEFCTSESVCRLHTRAAVPSSISSLVSPAPMSAPLSVPHVRGFPSFFPEIKASSSGAHHPFEFSTTSDYPHLALSTSPPLSLTSPSRLPSDTSAPLLSPTGAASPSSVTLSTSFPVSCDNGNPLRCSSLSSAVVSGSKRRKGMEAFSGEGHHAMGSVRCHLEAQDLWRKFHSLGTEMIITKSGRRMFPSLRVSLSGLDPTAHYALYLEIKKVDDRRYRYAYHRSAWVVAGKTSQPSSPKPCSKSSQTGFYAHPDNPVLGKALCRQSVSFEKVKLTNGSATRLDQVTLDSMHKYQPVVHLVRVHSNDTSSHTESSFSPQSYWSSAKPSDRRSFQFTETSFIGVTAYQNQLITQLKIDSNPFAKGFRDSARVGHLTRDTMSHFLESGHSSRALSQDLKAAEVALLGPTPSALYHRYLLTSASATAAANNWSSLRSVMSPRIGHPQWPISSQLSRQDFEVSQKNLAFLLKHHVV